MPMNPVIADPDFNGVRYSRTSCNLRWDGVLVSGWKSFNAKSPLKPGKVWGNKAKPRGRTTGKFDPTSECELLFEDFINLKNRLAAKGLAVGRGYKQVSSVVTFTAFEVERGAVVIVVLGVRISDEDFGPSDGNDDPLSVKLSLDVMDVVTDGTPSVIDTTPPI